MDSPFLQPGFIIPTAMAAIAFIAWLIRLESKVGTNSTRADKIEKDIEKLWTELDAHEKNAAIHFNEKVSKLIDEKNAYRFEQIEIQLKEMNTKLDRMAGK
ncbi:MAG: hypothetical protein R2682_01920 [Pyrinomonadaceae bacterium]